MPALSWRRRLGVACVLALVVLAPALAAGCVYRPLGPTEVSGEVTGYAPTQSFLKLEVEREDGRRMSLEFDRRDWHVRALIERVDQRELRELVVAGQERNIPGAVLAERFLTPEELNELRFEAMGASAEERDRLDGEYDAWLAERAAQGLPAEEPVELPPFEPVVPHAPPAVSAP